MLASARAAGAVMEPAAGAAVVGDNGNDGHGNDGGGSSNGSGGDSGRSLSIDGGSVDDDVSDYGGFGGGIGCGGGNSNSNSDDGGSDCGGMKRQQSTSNGQMRVVDTSTMAGDDEQ